MVFLAIRRYQIEFELMNITLVFLWKRVIKHEDMYFSFDPGFFWNTKELLQHFNVAFSTFWKKRDTWWGQGRIRRSPVSWRSSFSVVSLGWWININRRLPAMEDWYGSWHCERGELQGWAAQPTWLRPPVLLGRLCFCSLWSLLKFNLLFNETLEKQRAWCFRLETNIPATWPDLRSSGGCSLNTIAILRGIGTETVSLCLS